MPEVRKRSDDHGATGRPRLLHMRQLRNPWSVFSTFQARTPQTAVAGDAARRKAEDVADVASERFDFLVNNGRRTGGVRKRTKQHAVSERRDCDRTVINGA